MSIESTPAKVKIIEIREEAEPYSRTGKAFRAYDENGSRLYMGAETRDSLVKRIREFYPNAKIV